MAKPESLILQSLPSFTPPTPIPKFSSTWSGKKKKMASCCCSPSLMASNLSPHISSSSLFLYSIHKSIPRPIKKMSSSFTVKAAKAPIGLELPKVQPKFSPPFAGFTRIAETWNSRACMIGLIGTFIVELILNKGILQLIGVDIGKGLDLPL